MYGSEPNFENNNEKILVHSDVKYWFFFIIGIFLGFVSTQVLNDIFSNTSLSNGSWKWMLIFLIIPNLIKLFLLRKSTFYYESLQSYFSSFEYKLDTRLFKNVFENMIVLIPLTLLILYSSSFWLPTSVLPENKQFSEILFINVVSYHFHVTDLLGVHPCLIGGEDHLNLLTKSKSR